MRRRARCLDAFRPQIVVLLCTLALSVPGWAQETGSGASRAEGAQGAGAPLLEAPIDELSILLTPLDLDTLEQLRLDIMSRVRANAGELADTIVARLRLAKAGDTSDAEIDAVGERTILLMIGKQQLIARAGMVLKAIEMKGGDTAEDRAYLEAIQSLRPDLAATVGR